MQPRFYLDNSMWEKLACFDNTKKELFIQLSQPGIIKPIASETNFIELWGTHCYPSTIDIGNKVVDLMMRAMYRNPKILKSAPALIIEDYELGSRNRHTLKIYHPQSNIYFRKSINEFFRAAHGIGDSLKKIMALYAEYEKMNVSFLNICTQFITDIRQQYAPKALRLQRKQVSNDPEDFLKELDRWPQRVASAGAKNLGITRRVRLDIPLSRMGLLGILARANCYLLYNQIKQNMNPQKGDANDMFHCILGGIIGRFVTDEKQHKLPGMIRFAWKGNRNIKCYSYDSFIQFLEQKRNEMSCPIS